MRGNTTHWVVAGVGLLAVVAWGTLTAIDAGTTGDASASVPGGRPEPTRPSSPFSARSPEGAVPKRPAAAPDVEGSAVPDAAPPAPDAAAPGAGPDRALVRHALARAFRESFPDRVPSEARLDELTDTLLELRAHREALRRLPLTAETAERRRALREAVAESVARFEETAEVPLDAFSDRAEPGRGLTRQEDEDDVEFRPLQP